MTLFKIKIKVIEIKTVSHDFSFRPDIKHIGSGMSRGNFEISGKVQKHLIRELFLKSDVSITANPGES